MSRLMTVLSVLVALGAAPDARAQGRVDTRALTCASLRALVARQGEAVLASSELVYERVYRDSGTCPRDETSQPAFEPTSDERTCFAGWRCIQRSNDPGQK
jgi:hypothetical protein